MDRPSLCCCTWWKTASFPKVTSTRSEVCCARTRRGGSRDPAPRAREFGGVQRAGRGADRDRFRRAVSVARTTAGRNADLSTDNPGRLPAAAAVTALAAAFRRGVVGGLDLHRRNPRRGRARATVFVRGDGGIGSRRRYSGAFVVAGGRTAPAAAVSPWRGVPHAAASDVRRLATRPARARRGRPLAGSFEPGGVRSPKSD